MADTSYDSCQWCGGELEKEMDWDASLAFSTYDDYHWTCTECKWSEYKGDERFTFTEYK